MKDLKKFMTELQGVARMKNTADFKLVMGADGKPKKMRAHRIKVGDRAPRVGDDPEQDVEDVKEETSRIKDPPFVLVFKRKAIRPYPGGMKVAMYYNKNLDKYVTVPYGKGMDNIVQAEEEVFSFTDYLEEGKQVMDHLHDITKNKAKKSVKFENGQTMGVDHFTASAITAVHGKVNDENKKKLSAMVHKSPAHLKKAADFAFKAMK
tara:strand:+ start:851 stop:1471 length:621 start_codon:yes stop_codon:yes gene_type:complete